jgi:hypothetical protein
MTSLRSLFLSLAVLSTGCSYAYKNPAEALGPGEVGGRTVADVQVTLDGVAVSVKGAGSDKGAGLDATSRQSGRFAMLPLPVGRHTLVFRKGKERALQREVEIGWGKDGQPQGLWLGDVEVPATAGIYGECEGPPDVYLADNGVAIDEVSGAMVPVYGGSYGDFTFEGLPVGEHRIRVFVSDEYGNPYVGVSGAVQLLPSDAATVKDMSRFTLHPVGTDPATVTLRFRLARAAGEATSLSLADLQVVGLPLSVGFASDGSAQVEVPEGLWTVGIQLPSTLTDVAPPPQVTFVAVAGQVVDLGTLYGVTGKAASRAASACHTDADCAPAGTCDPSGTCLGWTAALAAPADVPWCNLDELGCSVGFPLGGVWNSLTYTNDPPYTMTCAEDIDGLWQVGVACGSRCTPDGVAVVTAEPGVGGCPSLGKLVVTPAAGTGDIACSLADVVFTVSGGTPPYTWDSSAAGSGFPSTDTTQFTWGTCDSGNPGTFQLTVTDSSTPPLTGSATITVIN